MCRMCLMDIAGLDPIPDQGNYFTSLISDKKKRRDKTGE